MRGAFGKPQGTCARVAIGQILLSIRCKDVHNPQVGPIFSSMHRSTLWLSLQARIVLVLCLCTAAACMVMLL